MSCNGSFQLKQFYDFMFWKAQAKVPLSGKVVNLQYSQSYSLHNSLCKVSIYAFVFIGCVLESILFFTNLQSTEQHVKSAMWLRAFDIYPVLGQTVCIEALGDIMRQYVAFTGWIWDGRLEDCRSKTHVAPYFRRVMRLVINPLSTVSCLIVTQLQHICKAGGSNPAYLSTQPVLSFTLCPQ